MKSLIFFLLAYVFVQQAAAVDSRHIHDLSSRHAHQSHAKHARTLQQRSSAKKCQLRASNSTPKTQPSSSTNSTKSAPANPANTPPSGGIIKVQDSQCGPNGATTSITAVTGPNGALDWLDCGINDAGGWTPPFITLNEIVTSNLPDVVNQSGSPFQACVDYVWAFEQYGQQYGLPSIILASFALQESSCNPNTVGGAGEQGLMQLTKDKCGNAPDGNCKDVGYNVQTGAEFFSQTLSSNGGDLLLSIGEYNGWYKGLTYAEATAAADTSCCRCQNNLDYLFQFLNGWILNINAYSHNPPLGKYFNLNQC